MASHNTHLRIGLCGAGIGGVAASIAIARAGLQVTILEAAAELGEIGAGIQMTPNVSRLLIKWGVADVIGDNLVEFEELNMRKMDGTKVGYTKMVPNVRRDLGLPWWLVHRAHLHDGLVAIARKEGVELVTDARVSSVDETSSPVKVTTYKGDTYEFDLLIGSDGLNSVVRKLLYPGYVPYSPTGNCAYRAIVPYAQLREDPVTAPLAEKLTMEVWMAENKYIITYPISNGRDFNMVLSHHVPLDKVPLPGQAPEVSLEEFCDTYKNFDPRIVKVIGMVKNRVQRWPLRVTGPLPSWSNKQKTVVLMGDAAHSMVNHMAQGAATAMEDGAFLGRCLGAVKSGRITLAQAIEIYEKTRMPLADAKQQVSFLNGAIWHLPDGPEAEARNNAMKPELTGERGARSPNLYGDPGTILSVYAYDAEFDADNAIDAFLDGREPRDKQTGITRLKHEQFLGWFLPKQAARL